MSHTSSLNSLPNNFPEINPLEFLDYTEEERDAIIIDLLERVKHKNFTIADTGTSRWQTGWQENLDLLLKTGDIDQSLTPKYFKPGLPLRFNGEFVKSVNPNILLDWFRLFRTWFVDQYLSSYDYIFEFGCGSCSNLAYIAQRYPNKTLIGLDWVEPTIRICDELRLSHGLNITGKIFDIFNPDHNIEFPANSAVLTVAALEQTGSRWQPFMNFLLERKPAICVNIEPIVEWYNPLNLVDYTAIEIHNARNYLTGFIPHISNLKLEGKIDVLELEKSHLGSLMTDAYNQIVWRPL